MSNNKEIILCPTCNGLGKYYKRVSLHGSEMVPCEKCDGKGRLFKCITVTYEKLSD